jgi:hypothetical protein
LDWQESNVQIVLARIGWYCIFLIVIWVTVELIVLFVAYDNPCRGLKFNFNFTNFHKYELMNSFNSFKMINCLNVQFFCYGRCWSWKMWCS